MHWHAGCSGATGHDQTVHSVHDFRGGVCVGVRLGIDATCIRPVIATRNPSQFFARRGRAARRSATAEAAQIALERALVKTVSGGG